VSCCNEITIKVPCCGCCTRDMFPPDRPLIQSVTLSSILEDGSMQFIAKFEPADDKYKVTDRTLTLTADDGSTQSFDVGDGSTEQYPFEVTSDTQQNITATLVDTNSKGPSLASAPVTFPVSPDEPTSVPPAPKIIEIVPASQSRGSKAKFSGAKS
jgi:hypothetical protein